MGLLETDVFLKLATRLLYITSCYAFEADDLEHTPLKNLKTAVGLHNFAWYTRESLVRLADIWIDDIAGLAKGKPQSVVNYVTLFDARAV